MVHPCKTWFITGASSGLGMAFAAHALARGLNVAATARDVSKLDGLLGLAPERLLALRLDVTHDGDIQTAVAAATARFGRIDVLINNAGYALVGALEETPESEFRAVMETNFFGALKVTRAILPILRAQGSGAIVNISSAAGALSFAGIGAYSATKFALEGASEALALEVAPFGVKVLIVEPGAFRTALNGFALRHMPAMEAYLASVGPSRDMVKTGDGTQAGDPAKAAEAVEIALHAEKTPLRLALGADAVEMIRLHGQAWLAELAAWENVATGTSFTADTR